MSNPFLGQITIVGFNFAPRGYAQCNGQILSINQNQSLFALIGTTYGGDGRSTFALPDLRGRTPIHKGSSNGTSHQMGNKAGEEKHTLIAQEMPVHTHDLKASGTDGNNIFPTGNILAALSTGAYRQNPAAANFIEMRSGTVTNTGSNQSHNNMQPFLTIKFLIALAGVFPSRN